MVPFLYKKQTEKKKYKSTLGDCHVCNTYISIYIILLLTLMGKISWRLSLQIILAFLFQMHLSILTIFTCELIYEQLQKTMTSDTLQYILWSGEGFVSKAWPTKTGCRHVTLSHQSQNSLLFINHFNNIICPCFKIWHLFNRHNILISFNPFILSEGFR